MNFLARWRYRRLIRRVRRCKGKGPEVEQLFNENGIFFLPRNYHACIPTAQEARASFEYRSGPPPYLDAAVFDNARMTAWLEELRPFAGEFKPPREGDKANPAGFFWDNDYFMGSDALSYYCILRRFKPNRVIEVGCGFSTLVALQALDRNGAGAVVAVDPEPRLELRGRPRVAELVTRKVQDLPLEFFHERLRDGDVLFLDSTHTVKTGADCLYFYLKLLPSLKAKLLIHAHDIYLPEAMPLEWQVDKHYYFTEQYLLLAFLLENPHCEALYGSNYHRLVNRELFEAFNGPHSKPEGGSFWFRRC